MRDLFVIHFLARAGLPLVSLAFVSLQLFSFHLLISSLLPPLALEEEAGSAVCSRSTIHAKAPSGTANTSSEKEPRASGKEPKTAQPLRQSQAPLAGVGAGYILRGVANGDQFLTGKERAHQLQPRGLRSTGREGPLREKGGCGERLLLWAAQGPRSAGTPRLSA
ncbi:hypothetical protein NDU88_002022 [Pleurodeles waltl]|uniref:Uncharacterized protein n=1 Tax=Pleurodeles waltl TaxID=8319 RepID=A0AAV7VA17_PLEWA|nr:hypothetical protein NDU88_002022 [Pleurodeles waltl]